jgi:hypothetical protein
MTTKKQVAQVCWKPYHSAQGHPRPVNELSSEQGDDVSRLTVLPPG